MIFNFASVVPDGLVVFVPSYNFLHSVTGVWEKSKLLDRLKTKKKLFMEPKNTSEVDAVLQEYAAAIAQVRGISSRHSTTIGRVKIPDLCPYSHSYDRQS